MTEGKTLDNLSEEERWNFTRRVYATLLELWGDQHGVDIRVVDIRPTDGPSVINLIERSTP